MKGRQNLAQFIFLAIFSNGHLWFTLFTSLWQESTPSLSTFVQKFPFGPLSSPIPHPAPASLEILLPLSVNIDSCPWGMSQIHHEQLPYIYPSSPMIPASPNGLQVPQLAWLQPKYLQQPSLVPDTYKKVVKAVAKKKCEERLVPQVKNILLHLNVHLLNSSSFM